MLLISFKRGINTNTRYMYAKIYDIIIPLTGDKYLQQLAATSGIFIASLNMFRVSLF